MSDYSSKIKKSAYSNFRHYGMVNYTNKRDKGEMMKGRLNPEPKESEPGSTIYKTKGSTKSYRRADRLG